MWYLLQGKVNVKVSALKEPQSNGRLRNWSLKYDVTNVMELA